VGAWKDKSGGDHHVTASGDARPTYKAGVENGKSVIRFDGVANLLAGTVSGVGGNTSKTLMMVVRCGSGGDQTAFHLGGKTNISGFGFRKNASGYAEGFQDTSGNGAADDEMPTDSAVVTFVKDGNHLSLYLNGELVAGPVECDEANITSDAFGLGALNDGSGSLLNGDISELKLFDCALDETTRLAIEGCIRDDWGGGCSLSSSSSSSSSSSCSSSSLSSSSSRSASSSSHGSSSSSQSFSNSSLSGSCSSEYHSWASESFSHSSESHSSESSSHSSSSCSHSSSSSSSSTSHSSSSSSSSSSSAPPRTFKICFYGLGSAPGAQTETFGNIWLGVIADAANINSRYSCDPFMSDENTDQALHDFLKEIADEYGVVKEGALQNLTLKVLGYSWGGATAIRFADKISRAGILNLEPASDPPVSYTLEVPIHVQVLLTIDPITLGKCIPKVPETVDQYYNYYQSLCKSRERESAKSIFTYKAGGTFAVAVGNLLSCNLFSAPMRTVDGVSEEQMNVNEVFAQLPCDGIAFYYPRFQPRDDQHLYYWQELRLLGADVNHDTITWFVREQALQKLQ